jgi:TPR repeat protein
MHLNGQGTAKNLSVALKQFPKAYYDYQYNDAESFISLEYNKYEESSQSIYLAKLEAYLEMQDQIPSELQYQLGLMYLRGHGVKKDYQKALERFTTASKSMEYHVSYKRGEDFYYGNTVDEDHEIAAIYFREAAEKYGTGVQTYLDSVYLRKIEIDQQDSETMDRFDDEVEDIAPRSLYNRGVEIYKQLSEGIKNHNLSLFYIRKAAKKNPPQTGICSVGYNVP